MDYAQARPFHVSELSWRSRHQTATLVSRSVLPTRRIPALKETVTCPVPTQWMGAATAGLDAGVSIMLIRIHWGEILPLYTSA